MADFSKFDKQIDLNQIRKDADEIKKNSGTGDYPDVPAGIYQAKLESMEMGETGPNSKGGAGRPMLKAMFRLIQASDPDDVDGNEAAEKFLKNHKGNDKAIDFLDGRQGKMPCLFMNRVLFGTKNDANMIASAEGWLESLEPSEDVGPVIFNGYGDFAELILDIAEDVSELEYAVIYDPDAFNSITILEVYE